ncbi:MAG: CPBP family intramembrane metalloprotease [Lachnospiraceae bacterium]|nr:CPBP family intramembrane metalloprotease [Lachnospiraceae bacterium]
MLKQVSILIGLIILSLLNSYFPFLLFLIIGKINIESFREDNSNTPKKIILSLTVISVICAFAAIISFYYGHWNHSIKIAGYYIFTSWEMLAVQIFPLGLTVYDIKNNKRLKRTTDKSHINVYLLAFVPLLVNNIITIYERRARVFEKNVLIQDILLAFFTAALLEELFFRGFLYNTLKKITKKKYAILVSSIIFALWHVGLLTSLSWEWSWSVFFNLVQIIFVGMVCAVLYDKSGCIGVAILFHACNDDVFLNMVELIKYYIFR